MKVCSIEYLRNQFYQTALGNCYGVKLPKMRIAVSHYYNFRHTFVPYVGWTALLFSETLSEFFMERET